MATVSVNPLERIELLIAKGERVFTFNPSQDDCDENILGDWLFSNYQYTIKNNLFKFRLDKPLIN